MAKDTIEVRLRRANFRGEKGFALELKHANEKDWGLNMFCTIREDAKGNDVIPAAIALELTRALDLGYVMVACHDNDW